MNTKEDILKNAFELFLELFCPHCKSQWSSKQHYGQKTQTFPKTSCFVSTEEESHTGLEWDEDE